MRRATILLCLALLPAAAGCRSGSSTRPVTNGSPVVDATVRPATLSIRIGGAFTLSYDGRAPIQVVVPDLKLRPDLRLFSVALAEPALVRNTKIRAGVNLIGYTGDGKAVIPTLAPTPSQGLPSLAYVELSPVTGSAAPARFIKAVRPCTLETGLQGRTGHLECPALRAEGDDREVSLSMTWTAA